MLVDRPEIAEPADIKPAERQLDGTERQSLGQQIRQQFATDVIDGAAWYEVNDFRFEDIDTGIDQSGFGFFNGRFFLERGDRAAVVRYYYTVIGDLFPFHPFYNNTGLGT